MYGREIYEEVVEEFRQHIEDMEFEYLSSVAKKLNDGEKKWADFEQYVEEQAAKGYMTEINFKLRTRGDIGQSSYQDSFYRGKRGLYYGWSDKMGREYSAYHNLVVRFRTGKHRIEADTQEELFHKMARILSEDSIENFENKVTEKAGAIIGAEELHFSCGDINGTVVGENGNVKVTTFGAGGWNIQRYHFRCKVTALKAVA